MANNKEHRRYVNIFLKPADRTLNDTDLLRTMQWAINERQATITLSPEMRSHPNCYSIEVKVFSLAADDIYNAADRVIYMWMRELPDKGFPFDRSAVFPR